MNSYKDLSILSYKQLQSLAVKYRIPGNIKKLLLVKILYAVKDGNNSEVTKILTDVKKNRKKRTKKLKTPKIEKETKALQPLNQNSNLFSHQDYYSMQQCQQQYPLPWVGAEEEIEMKKYEDTRHYNLSYSEIRQLILYSTQSTNSYSDTNNNNNNNSSLPNEIMDLRTEATVSNYRSSLEANRVGVISQHQQYIQQPVDDCNDKKMSVLLKKMLQAPVGANLGAIASPVPHWSTDSSRLRVESPDNSETMTAKSDIIENDEIWQENVTPMSLPYNFNYEQNSNNFSFWQPKDESSFYKTSLNNAHNSMQGLGHQQSIDSQYQLNFMPQVDSQKNCQNWLASTGFDVPNSPEYEAPKVEVMPLPYTSTENTELIVPTTNDSTKIVQHDDQYCYNGNQLYTSHGTVMLEEGDFENDLHLFTQEYLPSPKVEEPAATPNYTDKFEPTTGFTTDPYTTPQHQSDAGLNNQYSRYSTCTSQFNTMPVYHAELDSNNTQSTYDPGFYQEQPQQLSGPSTHLQVSVGSLNQVQGQRYDNYVVPSTTTNPPPSYSSSILGSYWPRWSQPEPTTVTSRMSGQSLENTLNLCTPNYVDYTKLNKTSCVDSYKTPVMTLRRGLNSSTTSSVYDRTSGGTLMLQSAKDEIQNSPRQVQQPQQHHQQQINFNAANWLHYAGGSVETSSTYLEDNRNNNYDHFLSMSYGSTNELPGSII